MKEEDIRPQHIFDEYLALTIKDTKTYFGNCERESIKCPACGNDGEFSFNKSGFDYEECKECLTLFVIALSTNFCVAKTFTSQDNLGFNSTLGSLAMPAK